MRTKSFNRLTAVMYHQANIDPMNMHERVQFSLLLVIAIVLYKEKKKEMHGLLIMSCVHFDEKHNQKINCHILSIV